jgi:hypothetical protein
MQNVQLINVPAHHASDLMRAVEQDCLNAPDFLAGTPMIVRLKSPQSKFLGEYRVHSLDEKGNAVVAEALNVHE